MSDYMRDSRADDLSAMAQAQDAYVVDHEFRYVNVVMNTKDEVQFKANLDAVSIWIAYGPEDADTMNIDIPWKYWQRIVTVMDSAVTIMKLGRRADYLLAMIDATSAD